MKKYIIAAIAALTLAAGWAQSGGDGENNDDWVIFDAMRNELSRNMNELKMENAGTPFWMGFVYGDLRSMNVSATLGQLVRSQLVPQKITGTRVLLGDYSATSDLDYSGGYSIGSSTVEADGAQIRRDLWLNVDGSYKTAESDMARKMSLRRQNARTPQEEALPDMLPVEAAEKIVEAPAFAFDRAGWERRVAELSAVFALFPSLYDSQVNMSAWDLTNYNLTSEGVETRQPVALALVSASATVRTAGGEEFSDGIEIFATDDGSLPSQEELLTRIRKFASELSDYGSAPGFEDFYSGPVLFVGQPVFDMFRNNLLTGAGNGLLVRRKPEPQQGGMSARRLENRLGQRVLDRRFTVVNHSSMKQYEGMPLMGYYEIDGDGVIPPPQITLIEGGMLGGLLNGRIPTLDVPRSTGSNRFGMNFSPNVAPGTLEISADAGSTETIAELEAQLIALARADGLPYAYIVEKMNGRVNMVWRLDVSTGERELVRNAELQPVSLAQLKRVAGVSDSSEARNFIAGQVPASMIYPGAVLLEDVEIGAMEVQKEKPLPIKNPLER